MKHRFTLAALAAASLMGLAATAQAIPAVVASGPPPAVVESAPAPREGFVWVPGHYEWRGGNYVWVGGHWMQDRPGYVWQEARWVQRPDGSWHMVGGRWIDADDDVAYADEFDDRRWQSRRFGPNGDLDGDGIRNRDDRDRDGDGFANWEDDFPNNARRS